VVNGKKRETEMKMEVGERNALTLERVTIEEN
jgi:hypothetical protein